MVWTEQLRLCWGQTSGAGEAPGVYLGCLVCFVCVSKVQVKIGMARTSVADISTQHPFN